MKDKIKNSAESYIELPESLHNILDSELECVARFDREGFLISNNPGFEKTYGYSNGEMLGLNWQALIHSDDIPLVESAYKRLQTQGRVEIDVRGIKLDKTSIFNRIVMVSGVISDPSKVNHYWFVTSNSKNGKEQLSLERFQEMMAATLDMIAYVDKNHIFQEVSEQYAKALQLKREQIIGRIVTEVLAHEEDLDRINSNFVRCLNGEKLNYQYWTNFPAYGKRFIHVQYTPSYNDGNINGVIVTARDITDYQQKMEVLKETEEKFDRAIAISSDCITISRIVDGKYLQINNGYEKITGYSREEALSNLTSVQVWAEIKDRERYKKKLINDGFISDWEYDIIRKDGEMIPLSMSAVPVDYRGEKCIFSISRDISEWKRNEENLNRTNRALTVISKCNEALVRNDSEQKLLREVCEIFVDIGSYHLAWIGSPPINNHSGIETLEYYYSNILDFEPFPSWLDHKNKSSPIYFHTHIKAEPIVHDLNGKKQRSWYDSAKKQGLQRCIVLPLESVRGLRGALFLGSANEEVISDFELKLLQQLANNLVYGIQAIRTHKESHIAQQILSIEHYMLQLMSTNITLTELLHALVVKIEEYDKNVSCSILLADESGKKLHHGASAKLDPGFSAAIDGIEIGENFGSCGTAAWRGEPVSTTDVSKDPLWKDFRVLAKQHNIKACHSIPVLASGGRVIATFANYYSHEKELSDHESQLLTRMASIIGTAIEKQRVNDVVNYTQESYRMVSLATHDTIYDWDLVTDEVIWNEASKTLFGEEGTIEGTGKWWLSRVLEDERDAISADIDVKFKKQQQEWSSEYQLKRFNGEYAHVLDRGHIVYDEENQPKRMIGAMTDITRLKQVENSLKSSRRQFQALYDDAPAMFFTLNMHGTILSVNEYGAHHLGFEVEKLLGSSYFELIHDDDKSIAQTNIQSCFEDPEFVQDWELRKRNSQNNIVWVRETARTVKSTDGDLQLLIVCEDVTEAKKLSQLLEHQATHDSLTGLINRSEFEHRLDRILSSSLIESEHALCYLDLDQFKVINDTCGHMAGDELLKRLSDLLSSKVRSKDTLARLGGDEFGVLMEHCTLKQAGKVADMLRKTVEEFRFEWEYRHFSVGASIGLVPINLDSGNLEEIMSAADSACYAAKDAGRNRVHIFNVEDKDLSKRRGEMQWVGHINYALEEDRFRLYRQEIIPLTENNQGSHYEILLRLENEEGELIAPGVFLAAAERYNIITKLDRWVVNKTINYLSSNPKEQSNTYMCSINLSGRSLSEHSFLKEIISLINENNIVANKLCFEITETAAIANFPEAIAFISTLKQMGCHFALDDFGSGLSSFSYLKNLPVDFLKIDGAFIREVSEDPIDHAMVRSINEVGHLMGKKTIAEFVENKATLDILRELKVDFAQGYVISKPRPLITKKR